MGAVSSRGAWYLLYVNGDYKGVYNMVERLDEDFLQASKGEDEWDILRTGGEVVCGTADDWRLLCEYASQHDLSRAKHYGVVSEKLDLESFTAYLILNLWAQNEDWPHNNWYAARPRRADGKWFFLTWDAEYSLGLRPQGYQANSIAYMMSPNGRRRGPGGTYLRLLFSALVKTRTTGSTSSPRPCAT
jgi:spore coat protein CotH